MALKVIESGEGIQGFKEAAARTDGRGLTVLQLDVRDSVPFMPDPGNLVRNALPFLDDSIRAIPGIHPAKASTYTVNGDIGTLTIQVRTNPLVLLPVAIPSLIIATLAGLSLLGVNIIIGWRIAKLSGPEFLGFGLSTLIILGALAAVVVFLVLKNPAAAGTVVKAVKG